MANKKLTPKSWPDSVLKALKSLPDQRGSLAQINVAVEAIRLETGHPLSATWKATVRRTLQELKKRGICEWHGPGQWGVKAKK
jgi:hypothetical protein